MSGKEVPTEIGLYRMQSKVSLKTKAGVVVETMHHGEAVRRLHTHAALVAALEGATKILEQLDAQDYPVRIELAEARAALASATGSAVK